MIVCRVGGVLHAIEDNCSHADTPLSEGRLRGHTITCPPHGAQFDVRDGARTGPPAPTDLDAYRVKEIDGPARLRLGPAAPEPGCTL